MTDVGGKRSDKSTNNPGSPIQGEPLYLAIARVRKPHGVTGEMLAVVLTDFPERIKPGNRYRLGVGLRDVTLSAIRFVSKGVLLRFDEITTPEEAGKYRNQYVFIPTNDLPDLPEGEVYHHQLIGMQVETEDGTHIGVLSEILTTGANDVYVIIKPGGGEILVPASESVIQAMLPAEKKMILRLPEWE